MTLHAGSWDHHSRAESNILAAYRQVFAPLNASITALVDDLKDHRLNKDVLVVILGELRRTPKITYPDPAREHWADAGCVLMAGGGLKIGQIIGETDSHAEQSSSGAVSFQNMMATIYSLLGNNPPQTLPEFTGRPQFILDQPHPVAESHA